MSVDKKLNKLHEMLCDELSEQLRNSGGEERPAPALLNVIRQFLRDNHVDGVQGNDEALDNLIAELPEDFKEAFSGKGS